MLCAFLCFLRLLSPVGRLLLLVLADRTLLPCGPFPLLLAARLPSSQLQPLSVGTLIHSLSAWTLLWSRAKSTLEVKAGALNCAPTTTRQSLVRSCPFVCCGCAFSSVACEDNSVPCIIRDSRSTFAWSMLCHYVCCCACVAVRRLSKNDEETYVGQWKVGGSYLTVQHPSVLFAIGSDSHRLLGVSCASVVHSRSRLLSCVHSSLMQASCELLLR